MIKIGIVSFLGPGQSATDRFRYDVLARGLSAYGYQTGYYNADEPDYDVIIVPLKKRPSPILALRARQKAAIVIGDVTDDMLTYPTTLYNRLGQYALLGERLYRPWYYRRLFNQCDWVVAGSEGQAESFRNHTKGVSVVTDAIIEADSWYAASYAERRPCRLVWFGNVESLHGLTSIQPALDKLAQTGYYELHLITSPETKFRFVGKWPRSVFEFMARQQILCRFSPWSSLTCARDLAAGDIAPVPVEPGPNYNWHKPAGRVLLAMAVGLPVVASAIPAYESVIEQGQTGYIARTPDEWVQYIEQLACHPAQREAIGLAARQFALSNYGEKSFAQRYSAVIQEVVSKINS